MATHIPNTPFGVNEPGLPAIPIDLQTVINRLAMRPREAQAFVAGLADALIQAKDALDPDPDIEDGGDDELSGDEHEPDLGSIGSACGGWCHSQREWAAGNTDDCEEQNEDGGDINDEPQDDNELDGPDDNGLADLDGRAEQWPGRTLVNSVGGYVA